MKFNLISFNTLSIWFTNKSNNNNNNQFQLNIFQSKDDPTVFIEWNEVAWACNLKSSIQTLTIIVFLSVWMEIQRTKKIDHVFYIHLLCIRSIHSFLEQISSFHIKHKTNEYSLFTSHTPTHIHFHHNSYELLEYLTVVLATKWKFLFLFFAYLVD